MSRSLSDLRKLGSRSVDRGRIRISDLGREVRRICEFRLRFDEAMMNPRGKRSKKRKRMGDV
ncbi:hypothetical protein IGI04_000206 [Brassica rapa subsp. trilocularis]|uniref:Uncharacterized protein n=1 Tax=Brassica rapa subsp. trilocularis TaxID=1813537 RepID=A0ABQ7NP36_BRACM|nr:hypothetical protein IGI04_000206 [Brassica rapa subsp. trilocularis]